MYILNDLIYILEEKLIFSDRKQIIEVGVQRQKLTAQGHEGNFWCEGNFTYLDCGGEHTYICQKSSNCTHDKDTFYCI